jgi:hypothetical protein
MQNVVKMIKNVHVNNFYTGRYKKAMIATASTATVII